MTPSIFNLNEVPTYAGLTENYLIAFLVVIRGYSS